MSQSNDRKGQTEKPPPVSANFKFKCKNVTFRQCDIHITVYHNVLITNCIPLQFKCPRCVEIPLFSTYSALRNHLCVHHGLKSLPNSDIPCYETSFGSHKTVQPFLRKKKTNSVSTQTNQSAGFQSTSFEEGM